MPAAPLAKVLRLIDLLQAIADDPVLKTARPGRAARR
jgi:hypothetical protein